MARSGPFAGGATSADPVGERPRRTRRHARSERDVLLSRRDPSIPGEVLSILARLAPTDALATRTLLQMLLPGLVRLVGTVGHGVPEAADEIVALAWERIRTYPTLRTGSVAAKVVLDVRKQYVKPQRGTKRSPPAPRHRAYRRCQLTRGSGARFAPRRGPLRSATSRPHELGGARDDHAHPHRGRTARRSRS